MIYSVLDCTNILHNGFTCNISPQIINTITTISLEVGGKPCIFNSTINPKYNNTNKPMPDKWKKILPALEKTVINVAKEGVMASIDQIRSHINKMTTKTTADTIFNIIELFGTIVENGTEEELYKCGTIIFDIASTNKYYSKLYADLFTKLIDKYSVMRTIFDEHYVKYIDVFSNIQYVNPDVDYDGYCQCVKLNDKRRALSSFLVNLSINGVIKHEDLINIACQLLDKVIEWASDITKVNEINEITENIFIICCAELFNCSKDNKSIPMKIKELSGYKNKIYPGMSSKSMFKYSDIDKIICKYIV